MALQRERRFGRGTAGEYRGVWHALCSLEENCKRKVTTLGSKQNPL